jgi:hypothetical protein
MRLAVSWTESRALAALAALAFTACSGAPEPPRISNPISGSAAAVEADGGAPRPAPTVEAEKDPAEPARQPSAVTEPSSATAALPQPPATSAASAVPKSACETQREIKSKRPLFERPPLPCDRADSLLYYRRGADGACGPSSALTVTAAGVAALDAVAAGDASSTSGACPSPLTATIALEPDDARRLIAASCAAYNAGYALERGVGCEAAAVRLFFFERESKLGETAALPCPPHALDRVVAELEALAARFD